MVGASDHDLKGSSRTFEHVLSLNLKDEAQSVLPVDSQH
jgi:hypothetical protein